MLAFRIWINCLFSVLNCSWGIGNSEHSFPGQWVGKQVIAKTLEKCEPLEGQQTKLSQRLVSVPMFFPTSGEQEAITYLFFDFFTFWPPGPLAFSTHASLTWPETNVVHPQWPQDATLTSAWYPLGLLTSLTTSFWKLLCSFDFAYFFLVFILPFWPFFLNPLPPNSVLFLHESFPEWILPSS